MTIRFRPRFAQSKARAREVEATRASETSKARFRVPWVARRSGQHAWCLDAFEQQACDMVDDVRSLVRVSPGSEDQLGSTSSPNQKTIRTPSLIPALRAAREMSKTIRRKQHGFSGLSTGFHPDLGTNLPSVTIRIAKAAVSPKGGVDAPQEVA